MNNQLDSECYAPELDILGESFLTHLIPFTKSYAYDGELQLLDLIDSKIANATQDFFLLYSGKASVETIVHVYHRILAPPALSHLSTWLRNSYFSKCHPKPTGSPLTKWIP